MIQYMNTPDEEFCRYVWLNNPDPVTTRLLGMVEELVLWKAVFKNSDPEEAEQTMHNMERDMELTQEDNDDLRRKVEELESRTVYEMLKGLADEMTRQRAEVQQARDQAWEATKSEEKMKSKLDMWAILNR